MLEVVLNWLITSWIALGLASFTLFTKLVWNDISLPRIVLAGRTLNPVVEKIILTIFGIAYAGILWPLGTSAMLADVDGRHLQKNLEHIFKKLNR